MKLIQLEYFETVCRFESINKASEELHVSQPAVTKAIQQLEAEFDVALFHRFGNRLSLTEEGEFFLRYSKDINTRLKLLENRMHEKAHGTCNIKIGIPPMIGAFMFPYVFKEFKRAFPDINLEIFEDGSNNIFGLIDDDTLDMAIVILNGMPLSQFNVVHLHDTEILYCTKDHSGASAVKSVTIDEISCSPLILMKEGSYQTTVIKKRFQEQHIVPNVILYSNQLFTIKNFIKNDIASAFLIQDVIDDNEGILSIPLAEPLDIQIGLVWKKHSHLPNHALKFIRFMQRYQFND